MKKFALIILLSVFSAGLYAETNNTITETTTTVDVEQNYLDAIALNASDSEAYFGLIELYDDESRHSERVQIATDAIRNLGATSDLYKVIGDSYKALGDYNKALVAFQFAIELSPESANLYNRMGLVMLKLSNYHRAEAAFKAAVYYIGESNAYAKGIYLNNLGVAFEAREEYDDAKYYFGQSLAYTPDYEKAQENLIRVTELLEE